MIDTTPPQDLLSQLRETSHSFLVQAKRGTTLRDVRLTLKITMMILVFFIIVIFILTKGYMAAPDSSAYRDGGIFDNLVSFTLVGLVLGFVFLQGCITVIRKFLKKGPWFVGTDTDLIIYKEGQIARTKWSEFISAKLVGGDDACGTICLEKPPFIYSQDKKTRRPNFSVYMAGVNQAEHITEVCERKIAQAKQV